MLLKRLLITTLIISHLLINCAWASNHIADSSEVGYEGLHVHAYSHSHNTGSNVLSDTDIQTQYGEANSYDEANSYNENNSHDEKNSHDEGCHVHLVCQICADNTLHIPYSGHQAIGHYQLDYRSLAEQPPVPPPTV